MGFLMISKAKPEHNSPSTEETGEVVSLEVAFRGFSLERYSGCPIQPLFGWQKVCELLTWI